MVSFGHFNGALMAIPMVLLGPSNDAPLPLQRYPFGPFNGAPSAIPTVPLFPFQMVTHRLFLWCLSGLSMLPSLTISVVPVGSSYGESSDPQPFQKCHFGPSKSVSLVLQVMSIRPFQW